MLCSHGFQSALSPFENLSWPVRTLWPEIQPLCRLELLQRNLQELHGSLELMDKLYNRIFEEKEPFQMVPCQTANDGGSFSLSLDTEDFTPDELSVRQTGRKLRVSGKTEKTEKDDDGKGCYSYRRREFTREFDLPEGLDPEGITCYLAPDGRLHIQEAGEEGAPRVEAQAERVIAIDTQPSVCSQKEDSTETHTDTQDKSENMDQATCCDNVQ